MNRVWQPGDVAMVTLEDGREVVAMRGLGSSDDWSGVGRDQHGVFGVQIGNVPPAWKPKSVRPLVVIDPEDREQVERLVVAYSSQPRWHTGYMRDRIEAMQGALREFADPTPLKPAEPTGLGAVVEDDRGAHWVRASRTSTVNHWRCADESGMGRKPYAKVNAVRVLSEGVTP